MTDVTTTTPTLPAFPTKKAEATAMAIATMLATAAATRWSSLAGRVCIAQSKSSQLVGEELGPALSKFAVSLALAFLCDLGRCICRTAAYGCGRHTQVNSTQNLSSFGLPRSPSLPAFRPTRAGGGRRHDRHVCTPRCLSRTYLFSPASIRSLRRWAGLKMASWYLGVTARTTGDTGCEQQSVETPTWAWGGAISLVARRI